MLNRLLRRRRSVADREARAAPARATPARTPDNTRIYAVGDIHGRPDLLDRLHDMIRADAESAAGKRKVIIYLGDYVDRGYGSFDIIDTLERDPLPGFDSVHLCGNHEAMFLHFLAGGDDGGVWLRNGGDATVTSYGAGDSRGREAPPDDLRARLNALVPSHHRAFLHGLATSHVEGDYAFVHAGVRPGVAFEDQDPQDLMWIRDTFLDSRADHGFVVVHGHSPARKVALRDNRIGIDTGACFTGVLTAAVLEDDDVRFLQTNTD
jgi:serine/threonine protein phosphatase 1